MIGLGFVYALAGVTFAGVALLSAHARRWANALFQMLVAVSFVAGDLLGDLMHLSDREPFDFEAALDCARGHYAAETGSAPY